MQCGESTRYGTVEWSVGEIEIESISLEMHQMVETKESSRAEFEAYRGAGLSQLY